ncbi:DUF262 domain-containing protein [Frankia sp. AgB32]|nr:DUF262 domain-containing protein [Frankia sp. AgB32]
MWDAKDVRDLFDSLYRGFPLGTLLFWQRRGPVGEVQLGPVTLSVPEVDQALWVVDGQQRIVSLSLALWLGRKVGDDRFDVYFDLESEKFVNPRGGVTPPRAVPLSEALDGASLIRWLRNHPDDLEDKNFAAAERLGGTLRDFRIPAYVVASDDQELLRSVFDRVNSAGKPISRAQVFHALFASETEPGSPASVVQGLSGLGFGQVDENRVVQSLLAIRGGDIQRDFRDEFAADEDPADWYDHAEQSLAKSIEFLKAVGVPHLMLIPNTLPLPVLAAFFFRHESPDSWNRRLLARWLWRGWVHGFGHEGGQTPVLRRAVNSINPRVDQDGEFPSQYDAVKKLLDYVPDRELPRLSLESFNTRKAQSRLILLALYSLRPLDAEGAPVNVAEQLELLGVNAITDIVPGRRRGLAAVRAFWPVGSPAIRQIRDPRVLASHAIGEEAAHHLHAGETDEFLAARARDLDKLVGEFLDSRIEFRAIIRPPLDDLLRVGLGGEP